MRKGEIACNKQFLLFSQCFLPYMVLIFHFKCTLKMSSAISFHLDKSKILLSVNGLTLLQLKIGNMQTEVGYISYFEKTEEQKPIAVGIILGVVLPILAIIILLTICVIRRHRKHKPSQDYIPDVWKDTEVKKDEEEEIGMNHVSVKADMNGSVPDDKGRIHSL